MRLSPTPLIAFAIALVPASPARAESPPDPLAGAQALADSGFFEEAAVAFEDRARALFGVPDGGRALAAAMRIRLGLGQETTAEADAARLAQVYGEEHPDLTAAVTLARARRLAGLQAWDALRALPAIDRRAPLAVRLEAQALLGRALERLGRHAEAREVYRTVRALATPEPETGPGADALAEARFFLAEEVGAAAARVVLPPYDGPGDRTTVMAYLNGPTLRWIKRKIVALETAERAYRRVLGGSTADEDDPDALSLSVEAVRPTRWAVAAAARVGLAWGDLVDDFRRLPVPREWQAPEIRAQYFQIIDPMDEVWRQRAKGACKACLSFAREAMIVDEHTEACESWLSRSFRIEHPPVDELPPRAPSPAPLVFGPAPLGK